MAENVQKWQMSDRTRLLRSYYHQYHAGAIKYEEYQQKVDSVKAQIERETAAQQSLPIGEKQLVHPS